MRASSPTAGQGQPSPLIRASSNVLGTQRTQALGVRLRGGLVSKCDQESGENGVTEASAEATKARSEGQGRERGRPRATAAMSFLKETFPEPGAQAMCRLRAAVCGWQGVLGSLDGAEPLEPHLS